MPGTGASSPEPDEVWIIEAADDFLKAGKNF
jgi:hypothetical protein